MLITPSLYEPLRLRTCHYQATPHHPVADIVLVIVVVADVVVVVVVFVGV